MLVEFRSVSFAYPESAERRARPFALSELSFEIAPGEIVGVIGPNSSGKTTLIRLLTRVLEPAAGEIRLEGAPIRRLTRTRSEEHTSELQSRLHLVCRLLLEKKKKKHTTACGDDEQTK